MSAAAATNAPRIKRFKRQKHENRVGYLFVTPYLIGFLVFQGIPFLLAFVFGFMNVRYPNRIGEATFVGFDQFVRFFNDKLSLEALGRTGIYTLIYVPLIMVIGFVLAAAINQKIYCRNVVRTMLFMPYVSNMMAVAMVFIVMLGPTGPIGSALGVPLLFDTATALPTVTIIGVWKGLGLNMVTYLGALQNVPRDLLEAADIDGAGRWKKIVHVTIPMVSPTTFFLLISSIITSLQNYTTIQTLTQGGPGRSTTVMSIQIVRTAFTSYQTSYASAMAIIMFAIVMIFTAIQWRGQKTWVNY